MVSTTHLMTAADHFRLPEDEQGELLRGVVLPVTPVKRVHWRLTGRLVTSIGVHVDANRLGECGPEAGFLLETDPDTVLAPDVSFVAAGRVWPDEGAGWPRMAPDLAVEVLSPSNSRAEIALKVEIYLAAGVRLVWAVDPEARTVTVHAPGRAARVLGAGDVLEGEDVLPGYRLPLAELFA
jgi:Uma2 family endonuclease